MRLGATMKRAFAAAATLAVTLGTASAVTATEAGSARGGGGHQGERPTVVLVHGAFADASGWDAVITDLQRDRYPVLAVANPLRGLAADSAYVRGVIDSIDGPVVLVGHSYGGAVITNAATGADNVQALVYTAAFAPDEGETLTQLTDPERFPGSRLGEALVFRPHSEGVDVSVDPARFREVFAADLPARETAVLAATQRPIAGSTWDEPSGAPAWETIPSWYAVYTRDKALSTVSQEFFADRADAHTVRITASHAGFASEPDQTADLIRRAARATS